MTVNDLIKEQPQIERLILNRQFHDAMMRLRNMADRLLFWEEAEEIKTLQANYRYMLDYAVNGSDDAQRETFIDDVGERLFSLLKRIIVRKKLSEACYDVYINTVRMSLNDHSDLSSMVNEYYSLIEIDQASRPQISELEKKISQKLWVLPTIKKSELTELAEFMSSRTTPETFSGLVLGALLLRGLSLGFSFELIDFLFSLYNGKPNEPISYRALTIAVLLIMHYNRQANSARLRQLIDAQALADQDFPKKIFTICFELLRTRETERINRKMKDEIIPNMMKMGPRIKEKFKNLDEEELLNLEENPEWKNMLKKSGIADNLRDINNMQMEGADVMMSTFGHLKTFPFFKDITNWFIPFDPNHPSVKDILKNYSKVVDILTKTQLLCDSDIYSFVLSMGQIPTDQREMMIGGLTEQFKAMEEMTAGLGEETSFRIVVNLYVKNLFRFFSFFHRKEDLTNPFANLPNPTDCKILGSYLLTIDNLELFGQLYFRNELWEEAAKVLRYIETKGEASASLYQKLGFCYQKTGDYQKALDYYMRADMLSPNDSWTLHKIAICSRHLGRWAAAAEAYEKLSEIEPDNVRYAMALGKCYMETGDFGKAIKQFHKANYLRPDSDKTMRILIRALFLSGDFEASERYMAKISELNMNASDHIMRGNLRYVRNDFQGAIADYKTAFLLESNRRKLIDTIEADRPYIVVLNDSESIFPLVVEKLNFEIDNIEQLLQ